MARIGLPRTAARSLSADANLYCEEFEDGPLNDPENFVIPRSEFTWIQSRNCAQPEKVKLGFENGDLVTVNGTAIQLAGAISELNAILGKFGHGLFAGLEHVFTGDSVLEICAAPAAAVIMAALRQLEVTSLSPRALILKQTLEREWVNEAMSGFWASDVHIISAAGITSSLDGVSGTVTMVIDAAGFRPCSIKAKNGRYIKDRAKWESVVAGAGIRLIPQNAKLNKPGYRD